LFEKAGIADSLDDGCIQLGSARDVAGFMAELGKLRFWDREPNVKKAPGTK
jgi:catalase